MFRLRLALRLGESVVFDMRSKIYRHVLNMPMSSLNRMPLERLISRITSDVDVLRSGIQDVIFVSTVQAGSMLIAARASDEAAFFAAIYLPGGADRQGLGAADDNSVFWRE